MLINSKYHVDLFCKLADLIGAYASQGTKVERIVIASVLDDSEWAACWGSMVWTMDDIRCGTANLDIMEHLIEAGPNTLRDIIYKGRMKTDNLGIRTMTDVAHEANNGPIVVEMPDD